MPGTRSSSRTDSDGNLEDDGDDSGAITYEDIMGFGPGQGTEHVAAEGGVKALSCRLAAFRDWVSEEAKITVHPSVCVVNGEATDGTKNAPVLAFGPPPGSQSVSNTSVAGRVGMVDRVADRALYERTMGCQIRTAREIKKDEVMMTVPRPAMITPDLVASSDAGRAMLACCQAIETEGETGFWDTFENTAICETKFAQKVARNTGTQLLVKILQERKRAEAAFSKAMAELNSESGDSKEQSQCKLAAPGVLSTRAPILAFLIHQRFSPTAVPLVVSKDSDIIEEFERVKESNGKKNALSSAFRIKPLHDAPSTFAPYARTLPSSISLPICWKRNELALLAGCIPGIAPLQEIAARTLQLATEFVALLDSGILKRFPAIFPPGLITWERWVWAASVFTSRVLPVTCYLNNGDKNAVAHVPSGGEHIQSPREVWDELGVLVPLLDMVNHEADAHQLTWQPCVPVGTDSGQDRTTEKPENDEAVEPHPPRAVMNKKVRKGQQIYTNYGADLGNQILILQYGFAQMGNNSDEVRLGWGLMDAVGNVPPPVDFKPPYDDNANEIDEALSKLHVFESMESQAVNNWWTDERLKLLEKEAFKSVDGSFMSSLKMGKKMMGAAHSDGTYDPILLTVSLIGTMPPTELQKHASKEAAGENGKASLTVTKKHQSILRNYLTFIFTRKLEKLLENLNNGLKDHFGTLQLWTKASQDGIRYKVSDAEADESKCTGWQTFFDDHAYSATMEVEKRYYAMGPDSCVLTLYDGQLQALQASLDGLSRVEKFENGVLRQLEDLGFTISKENNDISDEAKADDNNGETTLNGTSSLDIKQEETKKAQKRTDESRKKEEGKASPSKNRRRNRKRKNAAVANVDRPPAIKLHIGNLSYSTTPSDLYDYFAGLYGRDNVLECHIPTGRETGKSRGFGFVTLPENIARQVLQSGRKHEVDHRVLKIAESNSAGSGKPNRVNAIQSPISSDRCGTCGYRPKYCVCSVPNIPGHGVGVDSMDYGRDHDYYSGGSGRYRGDRYSRSRSPHYGSRRGERDSDYSRDYGRDYRHDHYYRSRSRSYSRGRDRERDRSRRDRKSSDRRDRSHERSRDGRSSGRHGSRSRGSGRSWEHRSSRGSSRQSPSRSPSYSGSRRDRKSAETSTNKQPAERRSSLSHSPSYGSDSGRMRESQKRSSRSRSHGRSRKSRKKKRHNRSRSRSMSPSMVSK